MTIPDSAVNVLAGSESVWPVRTVFDRGLGALTLWLRMLWADSRSETSPQRVGCGISRHHSGKNACSARQRAGRRALSPVLEQNPVLEQKCEPVRAGRRQKRSAMIGPGGSKPRKLKKVIFLFPRRLLFPARFRIERRNPRLERTTFSLHVTGVAS